MESREYDMTMTPILSKYQYQKPKDFGDYMERCYPVSAVMDMLKQYSLEQNKQLLEDIEQLKSKVSNWMDKYTEVNEENKKLKSELKDKERVNEQQSKKIIEIINDSKLDKDAIIKVIVSYLTNQPK